MTASVITARTAAMEMGSVVMAMVAAMAVAMAVIMVMVTVMVTAMVAVIIQKDMAGEVTTGKNK